MQKISSYLLALFLICIGFIYSSCSFFTTDTPIKITKKPQQKSVLSLKDTEINHLLKNNPKKLGSLSIGHPYAGALFNPVQMPEGQRWKLIDPNESWGTQETIDFVIASINKVYEQYPGASPIEIGDISVRNGGSFGSHKSHQAGRDVDFGWYYKNINGHWWKRATKNNLDLARTWALIRALFEESDVELILIDRSIQKLLYQYAMGIGEDPKWLKTVFQYPVTNRGQGIIRHAKGHATHMHVRFYNLQAQEMGRRTYPYLVKNNIIKLPQTYVYHRVRNGETLGHLASRYRTTVATIKQVNGLKTNLIRVGHKYKIPQKGGIKIATEPIEIPPRNIPPSMAASEKASPPITLLRK
ncbi:MAG: penicillin-insensitive murein endopeptidase [Pseudomonadota bacterium]